MSWIVGIIAAIVFFFWRSSARPRFTAGPVELDWRDIAILAIIVIGGLAVLTHQMTSGDLVKILAGILVAQVVGGKAR